MCRDYKGIVEAAQQAQSELTIELQEKTDELDLLRTQMAESKLQAEEAK